MEKLESTLKTWRQSPPQNIPCTIIKTDVSLQPRDERLAPHRHRYRLEEQSAEHIACMRGQLASSTNADLEPILAADIDGELFLVDGHHRLRAYLLERRQCIPTRVLGTSRDTAVLASKLVNLDGAKLPMHAEQRRDAAWQYLAEVTKRGRLPIPASHSLRTIGARFGIAHSTVSGMLKRLPKVDLQQFQDEALDPGTGWPRWKHLRESIWKGGAEAMDDRARLSWQAGRVAKKLGKLLDQTDPDVFLLAVRFLRVDAKDAASLELLKALEALPGDEAEPY